MGMTMTQKILADHAGKELVTAGELVEANLDLVLGNDITTPVAVSVFQKMEATKVFDRKKVVVVHDHFTPNKDIQSAEQCRVSRNFALEQDLEHFYEVGEMGIEHVLLPEKGLVIPGDVVIGADSHTCTYGALGAFSTGVGSTDMAGGMALGKTWFRIPEALKFEVTGKMQEWVSGKDVILYIIGMIGVEGARYKSMEYVGEGIQNLTMDDRFTIANMATEAGAKNGIFPVDERTEAYLKERSNRTYQVYQADEDAEYEKTYQINLSEIPLTVAYPHLPENTRPVKEAKEVKIDQVVIGSCTNGRIDDLRMAAKVLKGKKVAKNLRCIVIPGSQQVHLQAVKEGLVETFIEAGAVFTTATCGPCLGGHTGILGKGERCVSTTNRNFVGRMGHTESEVYLASPAVAAASAVTGKISSPEDMV
ncbi:3-isopropylmalate dehydratase large subunit [Tindallia californiensis]|uniref:3-isopropylmalate dehydratase large subunit n=1 Tax=Tindallia californiensis TaxID=159292 RepID=A0A1H3QA15_9FIRM|nr:3-isopropylmalate dehydratase large subunit [Tindallia californiensis]SDZ09865.1 3-isopropylmalate dehydratase, large subunit [Tindallia californiensis]